MTLLAQFETMAKPWYHVIDLHDSACETNEEPLKLPGHQLIGGGLQHLYIQCAQDSTRVRIHLRVWNCEPELAQEGWSEAESAELACESGTLLVNQWTVGPAAEWKLPAAGVFQTQVRQQGRKTVVEKVADVWEEADEEGLTTEETITRLHALDGTEQYLVDFWLTSALP